MNIESGIIREIYKQTNSCSFMASITPASYSGKYTVGLSGDSSSFGVTLEWGKIRCDGAFVGVYSKDSPVEISGNYNSGAADLFIDNNPKIIGKTIATGAVGYFVCHSSNSSENFDIEYSINGVKPSYSYPNELNFDIDQSVFTGSITNNSYYPIRIYSGEDMTSSSAFNVIFPTGEISGGFSKNFLIYPNGIDTTGLWEIEQRLYTNFGVEQLSISVNGSLNRSDYYEYSLSGPSTITDGNLSFYLFSYAAETGTPSITISLNHENGSGKSLVPGDISGCYSGNLQGYIVGSGEITDTISVLGTGKSDYSDYTGTGYFTAEVSDLLFASGSFSRTFQVRYTGIGTGVGYTGVAYFDSGTSVTVSIPEGSGRYLVNSGYSHTPSTCYNLNPTGYSHATGIIYYNSPYSGDTSDILYIGDPNYGIVYGFHHTGISSLNSYLNANTGRHRVTSVAADSNTLRVTSLFGASDNGALLDVDRDNNGSMSVLRNYLTGGSDLGTGISLIPSGTFSASITDYITGSGIFSKQVFGYAEGTGMILQDHSRVFSDIWDLQTGSSISDIISLRDLGGYLISGNYSCLTRNRYANVFMKIAYSGAEEGILDSATLSVNGSGEASSISAYIEITGVSNAF